MTSEEIAAAIYDQKGFLVIGSYKERERGHVFVNPVTHRSGTDRLMVALVVIEESSAEEYLQQATLAREIGGTVVQGTPEYAHYYRTVPSD